MPDNTEPGDRRAVARTVAVIVLITIATVALRGYLPGSQPRPEPERLDEGSGSIAAIIAMLTVSIAAIAISVLAQALHRPAPPRAAEWRREPGTGRAGLRWRPLLIAAAFLAAWALILLLLMRWASPLPVDEGAAPHSPPAPNPDSGAEPAPAPPRTGNGHSVFGILAAASVVLVALSVVGTLRGRSRNAAAAVAVPADAPVAVAARADGPDLVRAAELGLAEMDDPNRDAREAIIACYLAMERELEKSPGTTPQDSDTPSEVLARAVRHEALRTDSATELVDLFEEARFSPHVMNDGHRSAAVSALRAVLRELQVAP